MVLVSQWTYFGVFILILLGQIGLPIPEEVILIMAGYIASASAVNFWFILSFAILAILATNNLSFWAGRFFGTPILKFFSRWNIFKLIIKKTEGLFKEYGKRTIFISRFIWNVRNWTPLLAGAHKMKWWDFQKSDFLAAVIYTPFLVALGYFFAEILDSVIEGVLWGRFLILVFFIVLVIVYVLRKFFLKFLFKNALKKKK